MGQIQGSEGLSHKYKIEDFQVISIKIFLKKDEIIYYPKQSDMGVNSGPFLGCQSLKFYNSAIF